MYLNDDRYFFSGDFRYYVFSQSNFGLGTDIVPWGAEFKDFDYKSIEQPMNYNYFKLHETISYNIIPLFFVGAGIHIDSYTNINDKLLDVSNGKYTYHYNYSKKHGFSDKNYSVSGISLNLIYDSRDNLINTNKGLYLNMNYSFNPQTSLKGQRKTAPLYCLSLDISYPISKQNKQHVVGFWAYGQFLALVDNLPYLESSSHRLGPEQSRSGKGYIQGSISEVKNLMYFESGISFSNNKKPND